MNELILGLLMLHNQTAYSIKKAIQEGLDLISSDSIGSIQASLKTLEKKNYISHQQITEKNIEKKVYQIEPLGKTFFHEWVNEPFGTKNKRNTELKKIFFMSFSDEGIRISRIQTYIDLMVLEKNKLELLKKKGEETYLTLTPENQDIALFQLETIQYGIDFLTFEMQWYTKLIERRLSK